MAADLTQDSISLLGVVETIKPKSSFWLNLCFNQVQNFNDEFIDFDVVSRGRRLAPFVAPTVQGKVMTQEGYTTKRFAPAYIKPKMVVEPNRVFKRRPGEPYTGTMSPEARHNAILADMLREQVDMHQRRREWMAANAIINDAVVVAGENYPTQTVSFGRAGGQTLALTGGNQWGQAGIKPLDNLDTWSNLAFESSGFAPTILIMGLTAWTTFRADSNVKDSLDNNYRGNTSSLATFDPGNGENIQYRGNVGPLAVYTYNDLYEDDAGATQPMMDQKSVVLLNPDGVEGIQAFGAIRDPRAGYQAVDIFPTNWISDDPAAEWLMTQSAPLPVVTRPNAVVKVKVLE